MTSFTKPVDHTNKIHFSQSSLIKLLTYLGKYCTTVSTVCIVLWYYPHTHRETWRTTVQHIRFETTVQYIWWLIKKPRLPPANIYRYLWWLWFVGVYHRMYNYSLGSTSLPQRIYNDYRMMMLCDTNMLHFIRQLIHSQSRK